MSEFYKMAVSNISKKGDTDIFPFPIEKYMFQDRQDKILEIIQDMDRNFNKLIKTQSIDTIKTCIPVGYTGFRWATIIDPAWNAFLLAEVLKISEQIEKKRIPVEEKRVFSYRMKYDEESGTLFDREVNWKAFYGTAGELADKHKFVITFDISDFYNRIFHEKLKNVLHTDVDADGNSVGRIMEIMAAISARGDQYGLPVGGNASRILAEALLIRTDNFMKESGMKFCRFVDDFIVFANSPEEAYSILNSCADYFLRNMGLSLQKNKTSIITRAEFKSHIKSVFDEIESEKDPARASILRLKLHKDKYSEMGDEDLRDLKDKIDGSELIRLLKSECRKTKINQMFGKQLVNAVQVLDDDDQSKAFEVLSVNFEKLYPVFPVIMRKAYYNLPKCNNETQEMFIRRLADLFDTNSYIIQTDNNASYAIRVLSLDKTGKAEQTIARLFEGNTAGTKDSSSLIRMNAIYAMTNRRNINWLTCRLQDFPHLSSWERRAVAASAAFLGTEGKTWRSTFRTYSSPMENLVGDWASEKLSEKPNWKLPL